MRGVAPPLMAEVRPEESAARDRAARGSRGPSPGMPPWEAVAPGASVDSRPKAETAAAAPALSPNTEGRFLGAVDEDEVVGELKEHKP